MANPYTTESPVYGREALFCTILFLFSTKDAVTEMADEECMEMALMLLTI